MLISMVSTMPMKLKAQKRPKKKGGGKKTIAAPSFHEYEDFTYYDPAKALYDSLQEPALNYAAFKMAYEGWKKICREQPEVKPRLFTVIDFSLSSEKERFFVIDAQQHKILHKSVVAHGKNSGLKEAREFSNIPNSNQSSLGFYLTAETYYGKHGLSLRLDGLEEGINHNARKRAIVIHNAHYASTDFIQRYGRLGRSFGCPALPKEGYDKVIEWIKEKTVLFIYHPSREYLEKSAYGKVFAEEKKV